MTDLSGVNLADVEEALLDLLKHREQNRLDFWHPYPKQRAFIAMGKTRDERLLMAPTQSGKCSFYNSLVDHPDGTKTMAGALYDRGEPFDVLAWDGDKAVPATVSALIKKPPEPGVRLYFAEGGVFEAALDHRILSANGRYYHVRRLLEGLPCLPPTSSAHVRQVRVRGAIRWTQKVRGFLARCSAGFHPDDGQPLLAQASGRSSPPSRDDAPRHSRLWSPLDDRGQPRRTNSRLCTSGPRSSWGGAARSLALLRGAAFSARAAYRSASRTNGIPRAVGRPLAAVSSLLRSVVAILRRRGCGQALASPGMATNCIVAYAALPSQDVYDFTVPVWHNYIAAGAVHHNSLTGASEVATHLTGLYPPDWPGRIWRKPIRAWAAGVSSETVRDVQQTMLFGQPNDEEAYGTGFIPRHCLLARTLARSSAPGAYDTVTVQHHTDGQPDGSSYLQLKAYTQGQARFQARTIDLIWWDEDPDDMALYTEGNSRWTATGGMALMTFTPWRGKTEIVRRFMDESNEHRGFVKMGLDDVPHFTPELIESMKSKYPAHEWPARIYGDPAQGAGQIFTIDQTLVSFPRDMPIPPHWAKIWGIDFGMGGDAHPFAAILLAIDRDTDESYVVATYRPGTQALPIVHADAMRRICAEAPVSWPHDGNEVTRGDGGDLMPLYKQFDLKMLPTHAHYAGGGYSTEAAVLEMQQGFQKAGGPGGLRVREDLADFWEEYRGYHRELTKDGRSVIYKRYDDLMSACQKAMIMKRHARAVPMGMMQRPARLHERRPTTSPPVDPWTGATL